MKLFGIALAALALGVLGLLFLKSGDKYPVDTLNGQPAFV